MKFRVLGGVAPGCEFEVAGRFCGAYCLHLLAPDPGGRRYIPEDSKLHNVLLILSVEVVLLHRTQHPCVEDLK
jgi:hypothetical protein